MRTVKARNYYRIVAIILLGVLLTACSQQTDLYLRQDERWELQTKISLDLGLLPELRPEFEGLSLGIDLGAWGATGVETALRMAASYVESRGMQATLRTGKSGGENVYRLTIKGQGWGQLNSLAQPDLALLAQSGLGDYSAAWPVGWSVSDIGNGQVRFVMDTLQDEWGIGLLFPTTFRIHGREIISTNGIQPGRGVATWNNPSGRLEAVLAPGSGLNLRPVFILLLVVVLAGVLIGLIRRGGGGRCSACGARMPRGNEYCPRCGLS